MIYDWIQKGSKKAKTSYTYKRVCTGGSPNSRVLVTSCMTTPSAPLGSAFGDGALVGSHISVTYQV